MRSGSCAGAAGIAAATGAGRDRLRWELRTIVCRSTFTRGSRGCPSRDGRERPVRGWRSALGRPPHAHASSADSSRHGRPSSRSGRRRSGRLHDVLDRPARRRADNPITVPHAAAARHGDFAVGAGSACTPVGERITGIEICWPMSDGRRKVRSARWPAPCGARPSSANAAWLSATSGRAPSSHERAVHRGRAAACGRAAAHGDGLVVGVPLPGFANFIGAPSGRWPDRRVRRSYDGPVVRGRTRPWVLGAGRDRGSVRAPGERLRDHRLVAGGVGLRGPGLPAGTTRAPAVPALRGTPRRTEYALRVGTVEWQPGEENLAAMQPPRQSRRTDS